VDSFRRWSPAIPCACRAAEDLIAIPVGAFADPAFPPPQVSVWEERKHRWVVVPDGAEHIY
jgi:hypothetical protein